MSGYGIPISDIKEIIDIGEVGGLDVGNVIEIGGDDMGMGLLANNNMSLSRDNSSFGNTISINAPPPLSNDITISPLEHLDMGSIDIPMASGDIFGGGRHDIGQIPNITINRESTSLFENNQSSAGHNMGFSPISANPEEERKEKADLINKLNRLEAKGFPVSRKFTMDNTLEDVKSEFNRLVDARQLETSIKFQRQMMMGMVTGLEMMNEKFNPLDWKLDGWSESVHENVEDFDEVFEELYDKYKGKGNMPPEARLLFMLAGSGFMFHMSNSFFRSKAPTMDDIMSQNPGLRAQFAAAAAQAAGPGFGNFMGMAMNAPPQQQMPPMQSMQSMQSPGGPGGMFFQSPAAPMTQIPMASMPQSAAAAESPRVARKEMKGPAGVDDILKTFQEVRQAEVHFGNTMSASMGGSMGSPVGPGGPGGFGMPLDGIPPMHSGGFGGPNHAFNAPAAMAAAEIQSLASDDMGSVGTSATGTRGGQRRRKAAPIGNTVTLNV